MDAALSIFVGFGVNIIFRWLFFKGKLCISLFPENKSGHRVITLWRMEKLENTSAEDWRQCLSRRVGGQSWELSWVWKPENNGGIECAAVWFSLVASSSWGVLHSYQAEFPPSCNADTLSGQYPRILLQKCSGYWRNRHCYLCSVQDDSGTLSAVSSKSLGCPVHSDITVSQQTATYPCC